MGHTTGHTVGHTNGLSSTITLKPLRSEEAKRDLLISFKVRGSHFWVTHMVGELNSLRTVLAVLAVHSSGTSILLVSKMCMPHLLLCPPISKSRPPSCMCGTTYA
jgi:hypothetical protein